MTRLADLGDNYLKLPDVLEEYERELDNVEEDLKIKGKPLEKANYENSALMHYYDQKRIELKTIVDYIDIQVKRTQGRLFRKYTESYNVELNERAKDKYIANEEAFLNVKEIYLEANEVYEKYKAVVDAFHTRSYALNNITKIRVASLENAII